MGYLFDALHPLPPAPSRYPHLSRGFFHCLPLASVIAHKRSARRRIVLLPVLRASATTFGFGGNRRGMFASVGSSGVRIIESRRGDRSCCVTVRTVRTKDKEDRGLYDTVLSVPGVHHFDVLLLLCSRRKRKKDKHIYNSSALGIIALHGSRRWR